LLVDCGEEAYAEFTYTKEFSDLYGRLTNALMAVKHHGRNVVDEILGALNMPTRRGMNTC
jgi:polyhydroxyalkanoate synthase subunit PhaE